MNRGASAPHFLMGISMPVKIKYVGKKEIKEDNVARTGVIWYGEGDVQTVPDSAAPRLLKHVDVWKLADDQDIGEYEEAPEEEPEEEVDNPPLVDFDSMDKDQLIDYALREFGYKMDKRYSIDRMKRVIIAEMNRER